MQEKTSKKKEIVYAFIDSQNLNLGVRSLGWYLDFKKFRIYLRHKFKVRQAFLFIGFMESNKELYKYLMGCGFNIIFKPIVRGKRGVIKGNVDAELVLHSAKIQFNQYDKAVVVSSDGDFYCLYEELLKEGKLANILVPNKSNASTLLSEFEGYKVFLEYDKEKIKGRTSKHNTWL